MSSLSPVTQLVNAIRSQLGGVAAAAPRRVLRLRQKRTGGADTLHGLIESRVAQIVPEDPQRGRKAFRVFLEVVLLAQFGDKLANDSGFHQMVDDVQGAMEADPVCHELVERAVRHLLSRQP